MYSCFSCKCNICSQICVFCDFLYLCIHELWTNWMLKCAAWINVIDILMNKIRFFASENNIKQSLGWKMNQQSCSVMLMLVAAAAVWGLKAVSHVLTLGMTLAFFSTERPTLLSASSRRPCRASACSRKRDTNTLSATQIRRSHK